jgi:hypothetical protein
VLLGLICLFTRRPDIGDAQTAGIAPRRMA